MADSKVDASFVFEGSVKSVSASNVSAVPADKTTAIIQVDHVRLAPRALAGFAGKDVTLRMAPGEKLAAGDKGIFFTEGLVFADHLAVQSLGHDPLAATETKATLAAATPVVHRLRKRIDEADAVVSGQVTDIRDPKPPTVRAPSVGRSTFAGPISEHTPFWKEAVINVAQVHKGPKQNKVVVRFPDSTDVRWRKAPRFTKGQKGTWLLHAPVQPIRGVAMAAAPPAAGFYTALEPEDFHSGTEATAVQAMITPPSEPAVKKAAVKATKKASAKKSAAQKAAKRAAKPRGKKGRA